MKLFGAIETGGTKTVCAIGSEEGDVRAITQFPTTSPEQTFSTAAEFIRNEVDGTARLASIGVGTFGPVNVNRNSEKYGWISNSPKPGWSGVDVVAEISRHIDLPVAIDTDVNCALRGEVKCGAGQGFGDVVYIAIGTGIGGGILSGSRLVMGHTHPEIGHMLIPKEDIDRDFVGCCPFHGARCAEGLASGLALALRWGVEGRKLDATHTAWEVEAKYLAAVCLNLFLSFSPQRIILGGGVMQQKYLLQKIRWQFRKLLNGYVDLSSWQETLDDLIVPVALSGNAGVIGACILANSELTE